MHRHRRSTGTWLYTSAFLLSLVSPVFHRTLCGHFKEGTSKRLELECVSEPLFRKMMLLACGVEGVMAADLDELLQLAALADRCLLAILLADERAAHRWPEPPAPPKAAG